MEELNWGEIITVFIACSIKLGLVGIPAAIFYKFTFLQTLIVGSLGGITGTVFFTFLIDGISKVYLTFRDKVFPNRPKKKFSGRNRFIIRVKKNFGLTGIAFITPVLISIPVGTFIAMHFYRDKKKVIYKISISVIAWVIVLYFLLSPIKALYHSLFS